MSELTVLADVVEPGVAVGIGPEPPLGPVEARAVLSASRRVPEGDGHVAAAHPLPVGGVLRVTHRAHPVLAAAVTSAT